MKEKRYTKMTEDNTVAVMKNRVSRAGVAGLDILNQRHHVWNDWGMFLSGVRIKQVIRSGLKHTVLTTIHLNEDLWTSKVSNQKFLDVHIFWKVPRPALFVP